MGSIVAKGSLAEAAASGIALEEAFEKCDVVVMLDISGSMSDIMPSNSSRWKLAVAELKDIQEKYPGRVALLSFQSYVQFHPGGVPEQPMGGTAMHKVLEVAKLADVPGMTFILVSDGMPDDKVTTLSIAREFKQPIHTVFIGSDGEDGARFLRELSALTGGESGTTANITHDLLTYTQRLLEAKDG